MTIPPSTLATHERRFQTVVVGGLVTVFAIVALSPHTERALFEEGRLPSAFAAVALNPVTPLLRRFGVMEPATFARAFRTGRPVGAPPATQTRLPGLVAPPVDQPPSFFAQPPVDSPPGLVADAGVLGPQGGPPGLQFASFTPGPGTGIIGTGAGPGPTPDPVATPGPTPTVTPTPTTPPTTTPTDTPTGTPTPTPTNPPVVSPIPEPASWLMLLIGLALVGFTTRRARRQSRAMA